MLTDRGRGAALGYPGILLVEGGPEVAVHVFAPADLVTNRPRLDAFRGDGYRRMPVRVQMPDGIAWSSICALDG